MLSELNTSEVINVSYSDVAPVNPLVLSFPTNTAYELLAVRSTITAMAGIVLPGMAVRDTTGTIIANFSIIPWQFAGTTITTTTGQTPDASRAGLFGPNIGSFIPSGMHVYNGWTLRWGDFLGTPGVIFDGVITFARSHFVEGPFND